MLKKLILSSLVLYIPSMGAQVVFADTSVPNGSSYEKVIQPGENLTTDSQQATNTKDLAQSLPPTEQQRPSSNLTDENGANGEQATGNQNIPKPDDQVEAVRNQDQTTDKKVTQNQNTTGNPIVVQNQNANITDCQNQTDNKSPSCQDQNASEPTGDLQQSQSTSIAAGQEQTATSPEKIKVEQNQESGLISAQAQEITLPTGENPSQSQSTDISTQQKQTAQADLQSSIFQSQSSEISNMQSQLLKEIGSKEEEQKQETKIEESQTQKISTSGSSKIKQKQTVDIKSNMVNTLQNISLKEIKETTVNTIKIIKKSVNSIVKVVQKILINNELVAFNKHFYTIDEIQTNEPYQEFEKQYDWGTLKVKNSVNVDFNDQLQSYEVNMGSFLSLDFIGNMHGDKKDETDSNQPSPPSDSNNNGESSEPVTPVSPVSVENPKASIENTTEELKSDQNNEQKTTNSIKLNTQNVEAAQKGNSLPNTATNNYNFLLFGTLLVFAGGFLSFFRKRVIK